MIKIYSAVLVLLLGACPALAQYSNPRVTVFGAGSFPGGDRVFTLESEGPTETDYGNGMRVGFRFGVDLGEKWGAEATYAFSSNDLHVWDPGPPQTRRNFPIHLNQFMVNGLYNFMLRDQNWRPFATVGVGLTRFNPTEGARNRAAQNFLGGPTRLSSSTEFGLNFGAGVERLVTENIGIRFDLRDNITGLPRYGLPKTPLNPGGAFYPVDGVLHDLELAWGVVFHLD